MSSYYKYVKPYLFYFLITPVLMAVEVVGEIFLPKIMADITNFAEVAAASSTSVSTSYIWQRGILMIVCALVMMAGGVGGCYFASKSSVSFAADLRQDVFRKIQNFSFKNIDKFSTGSLVTRLTNDITQLQNIIRMALIMLLRAPGMLIGAVIMAMTINKSLTLIIAIVIPLLGGALAVMLSIAFPRFTAMQKKLDTLNSSIQENLTNSRVVKSFVRGEFEKEKFARSNRDLKTSTLRAMNLVIITIPVMTLAMNLTVVAVVWFGGKTVISGNMEVGNLVAFTTYVTQILMSLIMTAMVILQTSRALASSKRIKEVLNEKVDLNDENAHNTALTITNGEIEFKNVSFQYHESSAEKVLDNISFRLMPGETAGIIGSTGAGKTTLVSLIPRLYDVGEGEVLIDGINVKDYSLRHLREAVGMVLQKNTLFSGTIAENLRWGNESASDEELEKAAKTAQAHDFITSFPDGYDTFIDQGGVNVSGGQKQRLCIARALLKKPKIIIFDDSTSAVDTATEANIRECFKTDLKDTTKLIIAQRIGSVKDADRIIVLDDGKIVGMGTHSELMKSCETYREIYYSQIEEKEAG